jgi:protease I
VAFRDVDPREYAGLFLSGGRAPEYLRYDPDLLNITASCVKAGKPVASVCHGIEILAAANCLQGRRVTTVAKCELDATFAGATFVNEPCVVDGNIVTARTWHDNTPFLRQFVRMLKAAT